MVGEGPRGSLRITRVVPGGTIQPPVDMPETPYNFGYKLVPTPDGSRCGYPTIGGVVEIDATGERRVGAID